MLTRLGEGYAVFDNTLNHPTISCNAVVAAETSMMGTGRLIELLGVPTATVSTGTSGGASTSLQVGDAIPGIFDGVFIGATFPDALSIALSALDSKLLNRFLTASGANTSAISEAQTDKVEGHPSARAWYDLAMQSVRTDPTPARAETIPAACSAADANAVRRTYQSGLTLGSGGAWLPSPSSTPAASTTNTTSTTTRGATSLWASMRKANRDVGNHVKCQLKPLDVADHRVTSTADETERLRTIFCRGVCDFSKPGTTRPALSPTLAWGLQQ
jgi:Tannase-like family of unknown function (DUF6351)